MDRHSRNTGNVCEFHSAWTVVTVCICCPVLFVRLWQAVSAHRTDRCFYTYASVVNCWSSKSLSSSRWETAKTVTGIASTAAVWATDVSTTHRWRIYMAAQQKHSQGQKSTAVLVFHVTRSPNRHATVEYDAQNQLFPPDWHHYRCRFSEHIGYWLYNVSQKNVHLRFFE